MIRVQVTSARLKVAGKDRFEFGSDQGHAMAVMKVIQFLALEVMPAAVRADHQMHAGGAMPPGGFAGFMPEAPDEEEDEEEQQQAPLAPTPDPMSRPVPGAEDPSVQAYLAISEQEDDVGFLARGD